MVFETRNSLNIDNIFHTRLDLLSKTNFKTIKKGEMQAQLYLTIKAPKHQ